MRHVCLVKRTCSAREDLVGYTRVLSRMERLAFSDKDWTYSCFLLLKAIQIP